MIAFAMTGILIGAILGVRFTVLAIIPAMTFALTVGLASAVARGLSGPTICELTTLIAFLQAGYLFGGAASAVSSGANNTLVT
jgi:hypothetical protein